MERVVIRNSYDIKRCIEKYFKGADSPSNIVPLEIVIKDYETLYDIRYLIRNVGAKVVIFDCKLHNESHLDGLASNCDFLEEVVFTDKFDTSGVIDMRNMFCRNHILKRITFGNAFTTKNVRDMSAMFSTCESLETIHSTNPSAFDTSQVELMVNMFEQCYKLKTIDILPYFRTSNVISFFYMFYNCASLTSLDLTHFDTSKAKNMDYMFCGCTKLTTLNVRGWNTSNVEDMKNMFSKCESLTSIDFTSLDDNTKVWNTSNVIDMSDMFYMCKSLTSLDVSHFDTRNVKTFERIFCGCELITTLDISNFKTTCVIKVRGMFENDFALQSITFGANFTIKLVHNIDYMFSGCKSLQRIDASMFQLPMLQSMRGTFDGCVSLETIDMRNVDINNAKDCTRAFRYCKELKQILLSSIHTLNNDDTYYYNGEFANVPKLDLSFLDISKYAKPIYYLFK